MNDVSMLVSIGNALTLLNADYYLPANIFIKFSNGTKLDTNNDFISFCEVDSTQTMLMQSYYNNTTEQTIYNGLDSTQFQIDFYGKNARIAANNFKNAMLTDYGNSLFLQNGYSIHKVNNVINLTEQNTLDRQTYVNRYLLKISLFNNTYFNNNVQYALIGQVNVINADTVQ